MPRKNSPSQKQVQAQNRRARELEKRHRQRRQYIKKLQAKEKRETEAVLKRALRLVRGKGIYEPKSLELTKYRKSRIKKVRSEYRELLESKQFFFVKANKEDRAKVQERAKAMDFKATKTGLFVPKEGFTKAVLKKDRKSKELYIERSGKVKRGPDRGRRYKRVLPLASLDELDTQRERIRRMAEEIGPLKPGERLVFIIREAGNDGFSHKVFSNVDQLLRYLQNYRRQINGKWTRTMPAFIHFLTLIELEKTETSLKWAIEHPPMSSRERKARLRRSKDEKLRGR